MPPMDAARDLFSYRKHWAHRLGPAPFLPMSRAEMDELGWDACDVILVTGDAYVDHPSFGMAIVGRVLESQGFRVGIIAQPDWHSTRDFTKLGEPKLFFGITGGNMDSMVNRYTADRRIRSDDAYTPHGVARRAPRPLRAGLCAARTRGVQGHAASRGWHRGIAAAHSALRLLVGEGAPLGAARRQGRPARLRECRTTDLRDRASSVRGPVDPRHPGHARHGLRAAWHPRGLDRDRLDDRGHARTHRSPDRPVRNGDRARARHRPAGAGPAHRAGGQVLPQGAERRPRAQRRADALVRTGGRRPGALCARIADPSPRVEPRQRARPGAAARRYRRLAQPAADPAHDQGDGRRLRAAVSAGAASELRRREDPRLRDDPVFGRDPARVLRRLHVLLDHRARGADHPEPLGGFGDPRDRDRARHRAGLHRRDLRPGWADREHVPPRLQVARDRERVPPAVLRVTRGSARISTPIMRR